MNLNTQTNEGIKKIYESMIKGLIEYLKTGKFPNNSPGAYMTAYDQVHKIADEHNGALTLFDYYKRILNEYMTSILKKIKSTSAEVLIDDFLAEHEKCNILIYWMKRIFCYLDKLVIKEKMEGNLSFIGMNIFKTTIYNPIKDKLFRAVNNLIKEDRECNVIYRFKIKNTLKIIEEIDYKDIEILKENDKIIWNGDSLLHELRNWFTNYFTAETTSYIAGKADAEIKNMSAPEYIASSLKYLDEENQRKADYIHSAFYPQLDEINNEYLIVRNAATMSKKETGLAFMFKNKKDNEVRDAYKLISRHLPTVKVITDEFDPYIRDRGEELYKNKDLIKDPIKFIPALIALKKEMDNLVSDAFDNYIVCQDSKNKAFSHFMSKEFYSKQLANYADYLMKVGFKGDNDQQMEDKLNDVINLFKCLNNKLVFQTEACKRLSDRLIQYKSISINAEKLMIQKLKAEAGVTYVNKMTAMMDDLENGKKTIDNYRNTSKHKGQPKGISFQTQVVQQGAWEISKNKFDPITLPSCLSYCIEDFQKYYLSRHKEHKLQYCYGLGTLELKYLYFPKNYISISTLYQYSFLIALEKYIGKKMTIDAYAGILGMNVNTLVTEASGLIFNPSFNKQKKPECGVIVCPIKPNEELHKDLTVEINMNFVSNSLKFQTMPLAAKKTQGETMQQEQQDAQQLRNYQNMLIDANITRIMKSRIGSKTTHQWLVTEVVKQIDLFTAQPPLIKERIETLIEKQIIKRDDKDRNCYNYLA